MKLTSANFIERLIVPCEVCTRPAGVELLFRHGRGIYALYLCAVHYDDRQYRRKAVKRFKKRADIQYKGEY